MNRNKAIQILSAGEKMLDIADGASSAWDAMQTAKTFSEKAVQASIGAEKIQKGSTGATLAILGACMSAIYLPTVLRGIRKRG